jgi:hypothetical protein
VRIMFLRNRQRWIPVRTERLQHPRANFFKVRTLQSGPT